MAIAQRFSGLGAQAGGTTITIALGGSFVAGDCCVVVVAIQDTTKSVSSFNDDTTGGPMVFTQKAALNVSGVRIELWATAYNGGKTGGSFVSVTLSGSATADATLDDFSGVLALGATATNNNTTADPTISLTTQDANNYVVGGFASVGATLATVKTGNFRRSQSSGGGSPVVSSLTDNTAASATSVTNAVTLAATTWAAAALELRSVSAAGGFIRQTRSGIALSGANYAGWVPPSFQVKHDGVDKTSSCGTSAEDRFRLTVNDLSRSRPKTCDISFFGFTPGMWKEVIVLYATPNVYEFRGSIIEKTAHMHGPSSKGNFWECQCSSQYLLNRFARVTATYTNLGVNTIVALILGSFTNDGFRVGNISGTFGMASVTFTNALVSDALAQLAELAGAYVRIDEDRCVSMFSQGAAIDGNAISIVDGETLENLTYSESGAQVRSSCRAIGASTTLTAAVGPGVTALPVADTSIFDFGEGGPTGWTLQAWIGNAEAVPIMQRSTRTGAGNLTGTPVVGIYPALSLLGSYPAGTAVAVAYLADNAGGLGVNVLANSFLQGAGVFAASTADVAFTLFGSALKRLTFGTMRRYVAAGKTITVTRTTPVSIAATVELQSVKSTIRNRNASATSWLREVVAGSYDRTLVDVLQQRT